MSLIDEAEHIAFELFTFADRLMAQHLEAAFTTSCACPMQQIDDVVRARVFVDQADQKGAPACQTARRQAGVIVQLLDDLEHARARLFAHVRLVVQYARDGLDRDAGCFSNVVDSSSSMRWLRHAGSIK